MDLLGYAAFSGMERVAIIIGALVIGYWGYRLYGRDRAPGLIFMGIACAVLVATLATGGSHLRSLSASYQVAGSEPGLEGGRANHTVKAAEPIESATAVVSQGVPEERDEQSRTAADNVQTADSAPTLPDETPGTKTSQAIPSTPDTGPASTTEAPPSEPEVTLASSQELGGRIVSVKSENVTLEWSREAAEPAAQ